MKLQNLNLDISSEASVHLWKGLDSDVVEYQEPLQVVTEGRVKKLKSFFMEGEEADNLGVEQLKKVIFEWF